LGKNKGGYINNDQIIIFVTNDSKLQMHKAIYVIR